MLLTYRGILRKALRLSSVPVLLAGFLVDTRTTFAEEEQGSGIKTEIKRKEVSKPLTIEDQHQLSLLGAHLLGQIQQARIAMDGSAPDTALASVKKSLQLAGIIRSILPKTYVTMTVHDKGGKVLYEDSQYIQAEKILVFHMLSEVDKSHLHDADKKRDETKSDAQNDEKKFVDMDVVLDIGYVERRLKEAEKALPSKVDIAFRVLSDAQTGGTELTLAEFESPLHDAQEAVKSSHEAAERKDYKAAQSNLKIAREHLALYRDIVPPGHHEEIDKLGAEITKAANEITGASSHERVANVTKGILDRIKKWSAKAVRPRKAATESDKTPTTPSTPATSPTP